MSAFEWLSELMQFFGRLIPQLLIIKSTTAGVKFVRGAHPKVMGPGLHVYWPIVTQIEVYPSVRQTLELSNQILTTKDGVTVAIGQVVVYTIEDMFELLTTVYEPEEAIADIAKGAVIEVVRGFTYKELLDMDISNEIGKKCRVLLRRHGVAVDRALVTDFTKTISLNVS
jgi:regulator of protease activity HflC (stomatin/prohibitin superfamily)